MRWLLALPLLLTAPVPAAARDVAAGAPTDLSVTIYRAPWRNGGSIQLNNLGGFAVVSETRRVSIPAGRHRLRFGGVVDGIIPASAVVSGIPGGILEKNQDAALLSPSALVRASRGKRILMTTTDPATGKKRTETVELVSASDKGIVFRSATGVQAYQCSGLPEMFRYDLDAQGLNAQPTLSVMTNSAKPVTALVTLTYISEGFDWSVNYTAHLKPDGKTLELGGWITLANNNSVSLPNARVQIVAGGLNRSYVGRFINNEPRAVADCWPLQTTSDIPEKDGRPYELVRPYQEPRYRRDRGVLAMESMAVPSPPPPPVMAPPPPPPPPPEQLGDLKLYRIPQRTTVAAMQMKQTRLLDQDAVPYETYFTASIPAFDYGSGTSMASPYAMIRLQNTKAAGLGMPLPAGSFLVDQTQFGRAMLVGMPSLSDKAEGEKVELYLGNAPDLRVRRVVTERTKTSQDVEVTLTNASRTPVAFELEIALYDGVKITRSNVPVVLRDGRRLALITVPAEGEFKFTYSATR